VETLTPTEIAKILKLHPFSVTRLAREKKLPALKIGGVWRFRKDHFIGWLQERANYNFTDSQPSIQQVVAQFPKSNLRLVELGGKK